MHRAREQTEIAGYRIRGVQCQKSRPLAVCQTVYCEEAAPLCTGWEHHRLWSCRYLSLVLAGDGPPSYHGLYAGLFFFFNEEYGLRMKASPVPTSCARQGARCGWRRRPHAWRDTSVECAGGAGSGCHGNKSGTYKVVGQLHGSKHSAATTLTATESTLGGSCAVIPGY